MQYTLTLPIALTVAAGLAAAVLIYFHVLLDANKPQLSPPTFRKKLTID
jgi:hypothetical protein